MEFKTVVTVVLLSVALTFAGAKHQGKHAVKEPAAPSAMALGMDSAFSAIKKDFDDVMASSNVKSKDVAALNGFFFKELKKQQPFYSFTRVGPKGDVISEVIRLVEKPDVKKRNLSKEPWVRQTLKKHAEYSGLIKLEETGRYYLLWAAPVIGKDKKGKDVIDGAVALKIDLWDCFHKFANNTETPFLVRMGKLHLYSNKWKDSIAYKEDALSIAGVKKISVRYPKDAPAPVAVAPVQAAPAPVAVDSTRIKATQDSLKAAQSALVKQKGQKNTVLTMAIIIFIVLIALLLFLTVPMIRQRITMGKIDKDEEL